MAANADAVLDPWCLVEVPDGNQVLFGFATRHPRTGGLSWMSSTEVVELDEDAGRAVTASGRRYDLGRRISHDALPDDEARLSLAFLLGAELGMAPPPNFAVAVQWVRACKVARHVGLEPPAMEADAVAAFLAEHRDTMRFRQSGRLPS